MPDEYSDARRKFLGYAIGGVAGAITIGYALPLVNYLVRPSLASPPVEWSKVGSVSEIPVDEPTAMNFDERERTGWQEKTVQQDVWVVKGSDGTVTAFSPVCPHLGCGYRWDEKTRHFVCPCHLSVYDMTGKVLGGPAPRPLDSLPVKVEEGVLYVKFEKFRLGIPQKVVA